MKILVVGSGGQLGQCLHKALSKRKHQITFCYRKDLDVLDFSATKKKLLKISPDVVINVAAYTQVAQAERNSRLVDRVNHLAVANIAEVCKSIDACLIHLSSDYVFDGQALSPYSENDTPNPLSVYGISKLDGERAILASGCRHITIRSSWLFSEYGENFMKTMLQKAKTQQILRVVSDQMGCPTYAPDLAKAVVLCLQNLSEGRTSVGLYHYCGNEASTWYDFAVLIFKYASDYNLTELDNISLLQTLEESREVIRPKYSAMNCTKFVNCFGGAPSDWKAGIRKTLERLKHDYHQTSL